MKSGLSITSSITSVLVVSAASGVVSGVLSAVLCGASVGASSLAAGVGSLYAGVVVPHAARDSIMVPIKADIDLLFISFLRVVLSEHCTQKIA